MMTPPVPTDEASRLKRLEELKLLFSPGEERFDQITRLARFAFEVQMAMISLVSENLQWFKSAQGLSVPCTSREVSFCGHALGQTEPLIVEDATQDPRFIDNPLVTEWPFIRFYAGYPLQMADGSVIGTLCLLDSIPRTLHPRQLELFRSLANWASHEIESSNSDADQRNFLQSMDDAHRSAAVDAMTRTWTLESLHTLLDIKRDAGAGMAYLARVRINNFRGLSGRHDGKRLDYIIWEIAQRLRASLAPRDLLARANTGEFAIYMNPLPGRSIEDAVRDIRLRIKAEPVLIEGVEIRASISIGVVPVLLDQGYSFDRCMAAASDALSQAGKSGGQYIAETDA